MYYPYTIGAWLETWPAIALINQIKTPNMEDTTMMTTEVSIVFKTSLPDEFKVPETQIQLPTSSAGKDLTQILQ